MSWHSYPIDDGADADTRWLSWNMALYQQAPDRMRPTRLTATLKLVDPGADGLPSETEREQLLELSSAIAMHVPKAIEGRYALRLTGGGEQQHIFYAPPTLGFFRKKKSAVKSSRALDEALIPFGDYSFSIEEADDEEWDQYLEAFPSEHAMQFFKDVQLLVNLVEAGHLLEGPSTMKHVGRFDNDGHRDAFIIAVEALEIAGLSVTPGPNIEDDAFVLTAVVEHPVDDLEVLTVHKASEVIVHQVIECGGDYGGWTIGDIPMPDDSGGAGAATPAPPAPAASSDPFGL